MKEINALEIFNQYNPPSDIRRCPYGRSPIRKLLDSYAKAAVNLYGLIPIAELVEIYNSQNTGQTAPDEVYSLLLPLVIKQKWYCFYKEYIVHYWAIDDFDLVDGWLAVQGDKPRYIPPRDEFLRFEDQYYESEKQDSHWDSLLRFIVREWPQNIRRYRFWEELKTLSFNGFSTSYMSTLLDEYKVEFNSEKSFKTFFQMLMEANNNTRLWSNKGYTPMEMGEIEMASVQRRKSSGPVIQRVRKIGLNDPCPCGSGKKYKKCCRLIEDAMTAQLSRSECREFYEIWYGLLGFINRKKKVIRAVIQPVYPNPVGDELMHRVREVLWDNPALIDDYLAEEMHTDATFEILKSWRDHHIKSMFIIVEYTPEYALVIGSNGSTDDSDRLFGVKGISRSLSDAMQVPLPIQMETVLLPFNGSIIYDGYISRMPISFGAGAVAMFDEMHQKALEHGVFTSLPI